VAVLVPLDLGIQAYPKRTNYLILLGAWISSERPLDWKHQFESHPHAGVCAGGVGQPASLPRPVDEQY